MTDEIKELKKQVEELKKENTELQRESSVHDFLDTGIPQERLDYQRELKKEIIRLKSLNRRAADEIRYLDNIIIDFVEGNAFPQKNEDDLWAGESSINLLNRLDGKTNGGYIENYDDLHLEMKTLDGYAQIDHPDFYRKQEHPPECKWHKDWHACDCGAFDDGGNTPERIEEQIEWLKKVAKQKEINKVVDEVESAAVKAAHKVMEQHSEAFEKLAEKENE